MFSRGLSAAPLSLPIPGRPVSLFAVSEPEPTVLLVSSSAEAVAVLQALPLSSILPTTAAKITHLANVGGSAPGTFTIALTVTQTEGGRTGIYTTEIAVPEKGVGMNLLLGTQRATAQYFGPEKHHRASTFDHLITGFTQTIPDGSAMSAFEAWLQVAEKSSPANVAFHLPESQAKAVISAVFDAALEKTEEGYRKTGVYASDIVQLLLRKKWINDEMYARGVVNALVQLEDWVSQGVRLVRRAVINNSHLLRLPSARSGRSRPRPSSATSSACVSRMTGWRCPRLTRSWWTSCRLLSPRQTTVRPFERLSPSRTQRRCWRSTPSG